MSIIDVMVRIITAAFSAEVASGGMTTSDILAGRFSGAWFMQAMAVCLICLSPVCRAMHAISTPSEYMSHRMSEWALGCISSGAM